MVDGYGSKTTKGCEREPSMSRADWSRSAVLNPGSSSTLFRFRTSTAMQPVWIWIEALPAATRTQPLS